MAGKLALGAVLIAGLAAAPVCGQYDDPSFAGDASYRCHTYRCGAAVEDDKQCDGGVVTGGGRGGA